MPAEANNPVGPESRSEPEVCRQWSGWPPAVRYRLLRQAAARVHHAWQEGVRLDRFEWTHASFTPDPATVELDLGGIAKGPPLSQDRLLHVLAKWQRTYAGVLQPREMLCFVKGFLTYEYTDPAGLRQALETLETINATHGRALSRMLYRNILRESCSTAPVRGRWNADPDLTPEELRDQVEEAASRPTDIFKTSPAIQVMRADLLGYDTVIKRFEISRPFDRFRYGLGFKPMRGRGAWVAAQVLTTLDMPTPRPLGFLEYTDEQGRLISYYFCAYLPDAIPARQWIKPLLHRRPEPVRRAVSDALLNQLLTLYRHGIYHRDTKTSNLLLTRPEEPDRAFFWIDLDGMRFGQRVGLYEVYRNLVQLNGSLGRQLSRAERVAFLDRLAKTYPWINKPIVINQIERHTRIRLKRELNRICGY